MIAITTSVIDLLSKNPNRCDC